MKMNRLFVRLAAFALAFVCACACAEAQEYDAQAAKAWLSQFAAALSELPAINTPEDTADPARAGQYLFEYEFGTVLTSGSAAPEPEGILSIDVRTAQVTDCRGVRVGMTLAEALGGLPVPQTDAQLYVLGTQESGYGWSWAYLRSGEVYGVEYITYGEENGGTLKEYTLTYVIDGGVISAIRMQQADATAAQAQESLMTAEEIASFQQTVSLVLQSDAAAFGEHDLMLMGMRVLGRQPADLVKVLGEPEEIQTLPGAAGRMLVYSGAVIRLGFDEKTGVETVRGIGVSDESIKGPRGLAVGMSLSDAASRFRCQAEIPAEGGMLYEQGDLRGEALISEEGFVMLRYSCPISDAEKGNAVLECTAQGGEIRYWHLYYEMDAKGGA